MNFYIYFYFDEEGYLSRIVSFGPYIHNLHCIKILVPSYFYETCSVYNVNKFTNY